MQEKNNTNLERMRELIEQLTEADIAYYKNDAPIMTDLEYDRLTEELAALEHDTGLVLSGSPTQKVSGEILESLAEVRHTKPMLSAGKTKSIEDLIRFAAGRAVLMSWKMDGLTLVLRYEYGKLKQAITRGREGIIGEDVTHTVRTFRNVPLTIPTKESFEVRGEGVISWENFRRINASLEEPYTHPRNLASGSTRKLDAGEASAGWSFGLSNWSATIWSLRASLRSSNFCSAAVSRLCRISFWMPGTAGRTSEIQLPAWNPKTSHIRWMVSSWNMKISAMVKALEQPDITRIA